jgi:hypothetical protein
MGKFTKLNITANTIVKRGAVGVKAIYKQDNKIISAAKAIRKDDSKLQLHSIMYMLNKVDSHGDYVQDPKVLEDACTSFMSNGSKIVKWTHEGNQEIEAKVQQLYIVPPGHPIWKEEEYVGAIANVIQFEDVELYNKCKDGGYETSIEGVVEESDEGENINKDITDKNKEGNKMEDNQETLDKFYALSNAISNILYGDTTKTVGEKLAEMKVAIEAFSPTEPELAKEPEKEPEKGAETKPDEELPVKKELDAEITSYVTSTIEAAIAPLLAQIEELKKLVPSVVTPEMIEEIKKGYEKELKEIKKEIVLSIDNSGATAPTKSVKKTALS